MQRENAVWQIEEARLEISRARSLITELMGSLDMQYGISHYLRQLYIFAYHELCHGIAMRQPELFDHASDIFEKLLPSFQEVAKQDDSEAVMCRQFMPVLLMDGEL